MKAPLYSVSNHQHTGTWHGTPQPRHAQNTYSTTVLGLDNINLSDYEPYTALAGASVCTGIGPLMDHDAFGSFRNSATILGDWSRDNISNSILDSHQLMGSQLYPSPEQASSAPVNNLSSLKTLKPGPENKHLSGPSLNDSPVTPFTWPQQEVRSISVPDILQKPGCKCTWPGCKALLSRPSDLNRHLNTKHRRRRYHCQVRNCGNNRDRGFSRKDKMRSHMQTQHADLLSQDGL